MKTRLLLLAAVSVFLTGFVSVGYAGQSFISINGGYSMARDSEVDFYGLSDEVTFESEGRPGYSVSIGGVVYENWRAETEFLLMRNNFDKATIDGLGSIDVDGDAKIKAAMGNVYYDFNNSTIITPFLTGGIGVAKIKVSKIRFPAAGSYYIGSDDDVVFASQMGAGVACQILDWLFLDLKYRCFATSKPRFEIAEADEIVSHTFFGGLRFQFEI